MTDTQTNVKDFVGTLRETVFLDRYALKAKDGSLSEHTPEETLKRVAWGIAQNEKPNDRKKWEKEFYNVMEDFKFVPGGRILSGAGTNYQVTYFNCFVIPSPKDSRGEILETLKQMVEIMARGGGVGFNISSLRPRGARVKKVNGTSSGPVNWAELFSVATKDIVQQAGTRRGALMLMLHDWHPDIEEFITVKQDLSKINGANLSVCVSDAFMDAVKADGDWELKYPDLSDPKYDKLWDGEIDKWIAKGGKVKVYKTVKARYLWDIICNAAWRSAEPGLHFLDRSNKRSNTWYFERLIATNPCVTADTLVATPNGWFRADTIKQGDSIETLLGQGQVDAIEVHDLKPVFKVTLSDGAELRVTAAHQFHAIKHGDRAKNSANKHFSKLTLAELEVGDMLRVASSAMPNNSVVGLPKGWTNKDYGFLMGMLIGDGCITEKTLNRNIVKVAVNTDEEGWVNIVRTVLEKTGVTKVSLDAVKNSKSANFVARGVNGTALMVRQSLLTSGYSYEKRIPLEYQNTNKEFLSGLLDGLFSTDGNIDLTSSHPFLRFKTTSRQLALDIRRTLLMFGIHGRVATIKKVADSKIRERLIHTDKKQYEVIISGVGVKIFAQNISLSHPDKQERLKRAQLEFALTGNTWLTRILSIEPDGIETVYDLHEPVSDTWITEGIVSRGCGEQPLGAWAVCNLGAMNLSAYVKGADIAKDIPGTFDYESFAKDVKVAMRFMDNVIDKTYYFFDTNEKVAKDIRRTGLGIMGLGDALIKMHLPYGSEESLPVIEKIFQTLRDNAYEASVEVAKEKGSFPKFNKEKYLQGYHIKALPKKVRDGIAKYGIRNGVLLTIAPTGTTSLVSGVSSGVEPVYEFTFKRHDRLGEHMIYHPLLEQWLASHEGEERPAYFVSANDLTPMEHIRVQAIAQEYIDSSISKTVNAPKSHTVEDVKNLYMAAYDYGLKGVTYMRDGSRMGVLERVEEKKEEVVVQTVSKPALPIMPVIARPNKIDGSTYKAETPVGETFITINHTEDGQPFEVFITVGKSGSDVAAMAESLARMISLNLRLNGILTPRERMKQVVAMLTGIGGSRSVGFGANRVRSLPDAVAKVLATHYNFAVNGKVEDRQIIQKVIADGVIPLASLGQVPAPETHVSKESHETELPAAQLSLTAKMDYSTRSLNSGQAGSGQEASTSTSLYDICPECGVSAFAYEDGCKKCYSCGHSEC